MVFVLYKKKKPKLDANYFVRLNIFFLGRLIFFFRYKYTKIYFSFSKKFVEFLASKKFFITTFNPYFLVKPSFFNEIFQKLIEYYDNHCKKKKKQLDYF